tara:strand:- start:18511 stop:19878 length:1368 start_codon:yes stop_codon:yes gene_type:complete
LSIPAALLLMLFFAISIGLATFLENDYGTIAARAVVFNSWWLELCLFVLCSIFIFNIFKYKLHSLNKLPILFLHLSFILIIIGAGITRYVGQEGVMRIREGSLNSQFISSNLFLEFKIHDNKFEYNGKKELLLSSISKNQFKIPISFDHKNVQIEYHNFIQDPVDFLLETTDQGENIVEFIVPAKEGGMDSKYLNRYNQSVINGINVGFDHQFQSDFEVFKVDSLFYFSSIYEVDYMRMSDQSKGILNSNTKHRLNHKTLYTINGQSMVFKNYYSNARIIKKSSTIKNDELQPDLLQVKLSISEKDTILNLYGGRGAIASKEYFTFNGLFFSFSYGAINHTLPFAIYLKDFQLERYPGSDSPSSFASEIQVMDGDTTFDYRIFMNNVLNYRGYRFFQSSYDKDEKGTILSVNQDKWGTMITYLGYLSLLLSVVAVFLSKFSRINLLGKKINNHRT